MMGPVWTDFDSIAIGGYSMEKKYDIPQISRMTDISPSTLRKYIRKKKLAAEKVDGKWFVTEAALQKAGLSARLNTIASDKEEIPSELALTKTSPGYVLLEKLIADKEATFEKWKSSIQNMHKEIVSVKDQHIKSLADENKAMKNELRDITRKLPKLFELEKLEGVAEEQSKQLSLVEKERDSLKNRLTEEREIFTKELEAIKGRAERAERTINDYGELSWLGRIFKKPR